MSLSVQAAQMSSLYAEPLPANHLRLLYWLPSPVESVEHLHFDLVSVPFNEARVYSALSYRWSDPSPISYPDCSIVVNGIKVAIGPSVHAALLQIYAVVDKTRPLWIDYLCIDQVNLMEKQRQILLMPQIYQNAACVIIWLGQTAPETEKAVRNLLFFMEVLDAVDECIASEGQRKLTDLESQAHQLVLRLWQHPPFPIFEDAARLFGRPWFDRVWTLQEAALACDSSIVLFGDKHFPYEKLMHITERYVNDSVGHWVKLVRAIREKDRTIDPDFPPRPMMSHSKAVFRLRRVLNQGPVSSENKRQVVRLLDYLRVFESSDSRDRILSAAAFLPAELVTAIRDAGSLSCQSLYTLFATIELGTYGNVQCLAAAGLSQQNRSYSGRYGNSLDVSIELPSWAPDWSCRKRFESLWVLSEDFFEAKGLPLYKATNDAKATISVQELTDSGTTLVVKGVILDTVFDHGKPYHIRKPPAEWDTIEGLEMLLNYYLGARQQLESYIELGLRYLGRSKSQCSNPGGNLTMIRKVLIGNMMPAVWGETFGGGCVNADPEMLDPLFDSLDNGIMHLQAEYDKKKLEQQDIRQTADRKQEIEENVRKAFTAGKGDEFLADLTRTLSPVDSKETLNVLLPVATACKGRNFFVTQHERIGIGPDILRTGDLVCLILGGCTPFVLRPTKPLLQNETLGSSETMDLQRPLYELVGECYVEGLMEGEAMEIDGMKFEDIYLV